MSFIQHHYHSFGLKIAAISGKKLPDANEGNIDNKNLYNDKELFDDGDLDWYDYGFRSYDPQIGKFPQLDPLTGDYPHYTPYQYAGNEPIANVDMDGLEEFNALHVIEEIKIVGHKVAQTVSSSSNLISGILKGTQTAIANLAPAIANNVITNSSIKNSISEKNRNNASKVLAGDKNDIQIDRPLAERGVLDADSYMAAYNRIAQFYEAILSGLIAEATVGKLFGAITNRISKIKYIGRLEDLKGIPRSKTLLDELTPNLGSPKANYYRNMSVLRKAIRDGYKIKDASWFRPNSQVVNPLYPHVTIRQTFLGAERNLLSNKGLWP